MKTLYLECNMGAAGDMLMAALLELHPDGKGFLQRLNQLGIPQVTVEQQQVMRCGIGGSHMVVRVAGVEEESIDVKTGQEIESHHSHPASHNHEMENHHTHNHSHSMSHHHTKMADIRKLISNLVLPNPVKEDVIQVYEMIAEAESHVHKSPVEQIHFHEVGAMDAVADIVGVCLLIHELAPERIVASPIHVGSGQVHCAHGILPVPAPATAYILKGIPIYGGEIQGELCTPTGAALLKHFSEKFAAMPSMTIEKTGCGMGKKEFAAVNCLRAFWGESSQEFDTISELCCNLDDMTPEAVGFAAELLMQQGALDVYTTSIQMKKNRPGIVLTCMCQESKKDKFIRLLFQHTTTLGVREYQCKRHGLHRHMEEIDTEFGKVHQKISQGYGVCREKLEYEDLAEIARMKGLSLAQVQERIENIKKQK
ncbi:MAG: nickel pincer cofactor biosynthesis protein LarC [Lachnospiraceae bacterium]|nr:nickel pincer cofactor biosynthesis protein LarC [Lachnospiraceae bacterium]